MKTHLIQAPCNIQNCNEYYDYQIHHHETPAIEAEWIQSKAFMNRHRISSDLWGEQPKVGESYDIKIHGVIQIDISKPFWVCYQDPVVSDNDFFSENTVTSMMYCLCEHVTTRSIATKTLVFTVKVIKQLNFDDICQLPKLNCQSNCMLNFESNLDRALNSAFINCQQIGRFFVLQTNYQGNCGETYIIEKLKKNDHIHKYILRLQNHWEFHKSIWHVPNHQVTHYVMQRIYDSIEYQNPTLYSLSVI